MHRSILFALSVAVVGLATLAAARPQDKQDEPADEEARYKVAVEAFAKNQWQEAARHFEKLLESERYGAESLYKLALCDWRRNLVRTAGERFEKFVASYPKH